MVNKTYLCDYLLQSIYYRGADWLTRGGFSKWKIIKDSLAMQTSSVQYQQLHSPNESQEVSDFTVTY